MTARVAVVPPPFVWLIGWSVIAGGTFVTSRTATELVTDPAMFVTMTV